MPVSLPSASHPGHLCYVRAAWADSWTESPLLRCRSFGDQAAPAHATAQLDYRYGVAKLPALGSRAADTSAATIARSALLGYFVKVEVTGLGTWFGILVDVTDDRTGDIAGSTASGVAHYTAYGLTLLLEKAKPIRETIVKVSSGVDKTIGIAIPVNAGSDGRRDRKRIAVGNNDATDNVFTDRTLSSSPALWTAQKFGDYLLSNFPPKDKTGTANITFNLLGGSALAYELPRMEYAGQNLWQILNRLIPRQRGLGWNATINVSDEVDLNVWSHSTSAISLPGGGTIPANTNTAVYSFTSATNIERATVTTSAIQKYDQVLAIGERRGSVFTVDSTVFDKEWSTAEVTDYNNARTGDSDFSGLTDKQKYKRNAEYRAEEKLARVFAWWRLPADWNGLSLVVTTSNKAFVAIDGSGNPDQTAAAEPSFTSELRIQPYVPLRQGIDYSGTITPATEAGDDEERDFLQPLIWFDKTLAEHLDAAADGDDTARTWSVQTRLRDDWPGLIFEVTGGQQHYIADDLYVSNDTYEDTPDEAQALDHDVWRATIYVQQPAHVIEKYPADASVVSGDVVRILEIIVPDAFLDYLVPTTTVGLNHAADGTITYATSSGGWIRDDRDRLKDIARLAYEWFGTNRQTLSLSFKGLASGFSVGTIITQLQSPSGNESINTAITSVQFDLEAGTTSLQTHYEELDFASF